MRRPAGLARMGRVFLLVLAIGFVPLAIGAIVIQRESHRADEQTLDRALAADAHSGEADLAAYFDRARSIAVLTAENPVFRDFYELSGTPDQKSRIGVPAFERLNAALAYLQKLYPGALGETCFIDRAGFENARVVRGRPARPSELSTNESIHPFFWPTFLLGAGRVYQAAPYLSPDMHEWVISNSTMIPMSSGAAIVHFEITVESLRRALARELGHHLLIVERATGAIVADSERPQLGMRPLGHRDRRYFPLAEVTARHVELLIEGEAGNLNEEQAGFLGVIRRNGERLLRVVGDLLFAAELDARTVELNRAPVDLAALVAQAQDTGRPLADERQITLVLESEPVATVEGDAGRLGQAIDNLLSNALKFTPPGGRVELRLFETGAGVHIEVVDTGMDISEEDQGQLFERFFRTSEATSAAIQGTGLGLAIVAAIVEAHGGTIGVESEVGFGTSFRIVMPVTKPAETVAA